MNSAVWVKRTDELVPVEPMVTEIVPQPPDDEQTVSEVEPFALPVMIRLLPFKLVHATLGLEFVET